MVVKQIQSQDSASLACRLPCDITPKEKLHILPVSTKRFVQVLKKTQTLTAWTASGKQTHHVNNETKT